MKFFYNLILLTADIAMLLVEARKTTGHWPLKLLADLITIFFRDLLWSEVE